MKKHFLLLVILTLFPFIASNAVGNRALKLQTNSLLSEDELSYCIPVQTHAPVQQNDG